jgi:DNA invertase Pin-like site-specific DNA recombinase
MSLNNKEDNNVQQIAILLENMNNLIKNTNIMFETLTPILKNSFKINSNNSNNNNQPEIQSVNDTDVDKSSVDKSSVEKINVDKSNLEMEEKRVEKRVRSSKEVNFIWTRISSENQENNSSLQMQLQECEKYINMNNMNSKQTIIFKNIGSGYSLSPSIKQSLDLINDYILNKKYKVNIICYMPDRLLRNKEKSIELFDLLNSNEGSIHFVQSIHNRPLISTNEEDKTNIMKLIESGQIESTIKSQRLKDQYANKVEDLYIKIMDEPETKNIKKFITYFIKGGNIKDITKLFVTLVDWDSHQNWNEYKKEPIKFNEDKILFSRNGDYLKKAEGEEEIEVRFKDSCRLLNQYKVKIHDIFKPRKHWSDKLVKLYYTDVIDTVSTQLNRL